MGWGSWGDRTQADKIPRIRANDVIDRLKRSGDVVALHLQVPEGVPLDRFTGLLTAFAESELPHVKAMTSMPAPPKTEPDNKTTFYPLHVMVEHQRAKFLADGLTADAEALPRIPPPAQRTESVALSPGDQIIALFVPEGAKAEEAEEARGKGKLFLDKFVTPLVQDAIAKEVKIAQEQEKWGDTTVSPLPTPPKRT